VKLTLKKTQKYQCAGMARTFPWFAPPIMSLTQSVLHWGLTEHGLFLSQHGGQRQADLAFWFWALTIWGLSGYPQRANLGPPSYLENLALVSPFLVYTTKQVLLTQLSHTALSLEPFMVLLSRWCFPWLLWHGYHLSMSFFRSHCLPPAQGCRYPISFWSSRATGGWKERFSA
jgi:hypothetical protein